MGWVTLRVKDMSGAIPRNPSFPENLKFDYQKRNLYFQLSSALVNREVRYLLITIIAVSVPSLLQVNGPIQGTYGQTITMETKVLPVINWQLNLVKKLFLTNSPNSLNSLLAQPLCSASWVFAMFLKQQKQRSPVRCEDRVWILEEEGFKRGKKDYEFGLHPNRRRD